MPKSIELTDEMLSAGYSPKVAAALQGELSADDLTGEEREAFYAKFEEILEHPGPDEEAFFAEMRQRGGGVGLDENGRLVRGLPGGGTVMIGE